MISTVLYRLLYMLGVMVAVVTIVFAMIHMSGDPLDALVPPGSSPEDVQVLREKYGLDESLAIIRTLFFPMLPGAISGSPGGSTSRPATSCSTGCRQHSSWWVCPLGSPCSSRFHSGWWQEQDQDG